MRDKRIDILKGIGIILVVAGHCGSPFRNYIYTFHMPLFLFISGYLRYRAKTKDWSTFIKGKIKTILIPYILYWILSMIIFNNIVTIIKTGNLATIGINQIKGLLMGGKWLSYYSNNVALWYLLFFFICIIVFEFLIRKFKYNTLAFIAGICTAITLTVQQKYAMPIFQLTVLPPALLFLFAGYLFSYLINNHNSILETMNKKSVGITLIMFGLIIANRNNGDISNIKSNLYFISAIPSIIGYFILSTTLSKFNIIEKLGKDSLYILGIHLLVTPYCKDITTYISTATNISNLLVLNTLTIILILSVSMGIIELYRSAKKIIKEEFKTNEVLTVN